MNGPHLLDKPPAEIPDFGDFGDRFPDYPAPWKDRLTLAAIIAGSIALGFLGFMVT